VPIEGEISRLAPKRKLSDRQKLALNALTETALRTGAPPPPDWQLPGGIQIVNADEWREELMRRSVIDRGGANPLPLRASPLVLPDSLLLTQCRDRPER
jgi:hypothetical protein